MVNPFFCELLGYDRDVLLGMTVLDALTDDEDKPETQVTLARRAAGTLQEGRLIKRYRHRDGHAIWVEVTFVTEADPGHGEFYGLAIVNDITAGRAGRGGAAALRCPTAAGAENGGDRPADRRAGA